MVKKIKKEKEKREIKEIGKREIKEIKGEKLEREKPIGDKTWAELFSKAKFVLILFIIALIVMAIPFLLAPKGIEETPTLPTGTETIEISQPNETIQIPEINYTCEKKLLSGGLRDDYSYSVKAKNVSSIMSSTFIGRKGDYLLRQVSISASQKTELGTFTSDILMDVYLDDDFNCVKMEMSGTMMETPFEKEIPCGGERIEMSVCGDNATAIRNETITVGAGTFDTIVYQIGNLIVWVSDIVDVPIKTQINGETTELISYKRG